MAHTKKLPAAAARGTLVLLLVVALGQMALGSSPVGAGVAKPPVATSVRAAVSGPATLITIAGTAPMPYTVRRPGRRSPTRPAAGETLDPLRETDPPPDASSRLNSNGGKEPLQCRAPRQLL